jgi:hypothetical protein
MRIGRRLLTSTYYETTLDDESTESSSYDTAELGSSSPYFYNPWNTEELAQQIQDKRAQIVEIREKVRGSLSPIDALENYRSENGTYFIDPEQLALISNGISGSYFLSSETGENLFVVKPLDEDILGLNNPKGFDSPNGEILLAAFREIAVYNTAKWIGVDSISPPTALAILKSDRFHDIMDGSMGPEFGPANKEKLCSLQQFVPNSETLFETLQDLQQRGLSDDEINARFDQNDFENCNLLLWVTGDTDGHGGNFLTYPKGKDEFGQTIFGLKKIDSGLAFPDTYGSFYNILAQLPNAKQTLSEEGRQKILDLNPEGVAAILRENGLESSIPAARERIDFLKNLITDSSLTIKAMNRTLHVNQAQSWNLAGFQSDSDLNDRSEMSRYDGRISSPYKFKVVPESGILTMESEHAKSL